MWQQGTGVREVVEKGSRDAYNELTIVVIDSTRPEAKVGEGSYIKKGQKSNSHVERNKSHLVPYVSVPKNVGGQ